MEQRPFPDIRRTGGRPIQVDTASRRIAKELRGAIERGHLAPGTILPSQAELARRFDTTLDTARTAVDLLKKQGCLAVTATRRLAVQLPVSDLGAKGLVLVVSSAPLHRRLQNPNVREMQYGVEMAAGAAGHALTIVHGYHLRRNLPAVVLDWPLRGIVICGLVTDATLREYQKLPIPVVLLDAPSPGKRLRCSNVDNAASARLLTEHVLASGHRSIAFVRRISFTKKDIDPDSKERQKGFETAMSAAGQRASASFTAFHVETPQSSAMQAVAGKQARFSAVIAPDPDVANVILGAAKAAGRRVPQDLSIVSFQGCVPAPTFSGMCINFYEMGRHAIQALHGKDEATQRIRTVATWIDAGTFAPYSGKPG